jgi:hypothetical protein
MAHFLAGWGGDPSRVLELTAHNDMDMGVDEVDVGIIGADRYTSVVSRKTLLHLLCRKIDFKMLLFLLTLMEYYDNLTLLEYYELVRAEYDELYMEDHVGTRSDKWTRRTMIATKDDMSDDDEIPLTQILAHKQKTTRTHQRSRSRFVDKKKRRQSVSIDMDHGLQENSRSVGTYLIPWRYKLVSLSM